MISEQKLKEMVENKTPIFWNEPSEYFALITEIDYKITGIVYCGGYVEFVNKTNGRHFRAEYKDLYENRKDAEKALKRGE